MVIETWLLLCISFHEQFNRLLNTLSQFLFAKWLNPIVPRCIDAQKFLVFIQLICLHVRSCRFTWTIVTNTKYEDPNPLTDIFSCRPVALISGLIYVCRFAWRVPFGRSPRLSMRFPMETEAHPCTSHPRRRTNAPITTPVRTRIRVSENRRW